jgi:hypothetical protein
MSHERFNFQTLKHGPVVAAFLTPNTSEWQGRAVQVTADGTWWESRLDGSGWAVMERFTTTTGGTDADA